MKRSILVLFTALYALSFYGQKQVFTYSANGSIISSSEFIKSLDNEYIDGTTPYILKHSDAVSTPSGLNYTIKYQLYNDWDNDPGDFTVIEIYESNKLIYSLKNNEGWVYFPKKQANTTSTQCGYIANLNDNAIALIVQGTTLASQPPLLTIIIIKNDKAYLVYNEEGNIEDIQKTNSATTIKLLTNTVEWIDDRQLNDGIYKTLTIKDGTIYIQ